jgi:influenza virus NS1A-binding protein
VCVLNRQLIAAGGCDAWNCTNTVERYDPGADKWTHVAPMFGARRGAGIARFKSAPMLRDYFARLKLLVVDRFC